MNTKKLLFSVIAVPLLGLTTGANAALVNLGPGSFTPLASVITFSEFPGGTIDPVYTFTSLPGLGDVTVSFGGHFVGQVATGGSPNTLSDPTPDSPLALDPGAPDTFITGDGANPTSPVLSGTPTFNGPISVLFDKPVAGVGLDGGFFDAIGGTTIEAYDPFGVSLGSIVNSSLGIEFFGLADSGGANVIGGISFYITGPEPAGFAIDNLTFGSSSVIPEVDHVVPEPSTLLLFGTGLLGLLGYIRTRKAA
jgi:hypothetical protein